jgi:hypothetical protein
LNLTGQNNASPDKSCPSQELPRGQGLAVKEALNTQRKGSIWGSLGKRSTLPSPTGQSVLWALAPEACCRLACSPHVTPRSMRRCFSRSPRLDRPWLVHSGTPQLNLYSMSFWEISSFLYDGGYQAAGTQRILSASKGPAPHAVTTASHVLSGRHDILQSLLRRPASEFFWPGPQTCPAF